VDNYLVEPNIFDKEISVPTSKSYANRLLILAAIDKKDIDIMGLPNSTDVLTMIDCLKCIGLEVERNESITTIKGSFPECEKSDKKIIKLHTGDGGTTNRFLLSLLARGKCTYELIPTGHMAKRPMRPLVDALKQLDVKVEMGVSSWISVQGPIKQKGCVSIDCRDSTQFATSLLLASTDYDIEIKFENLVNSKKYFDLTYNLVREYQKGTLDYVVPVDFSSLSYPLALAAHSGKVKVNNCFKIDRYQADSVFINLLDEMGVKIFIDSSGLTCEHNELRGIKVDGAQCPDIVPTIAFLASYASGETKISNIDILRHKECDRVIETLRILDSFGVNYFLDENDLTITGQTIKTNCKVLKVPDDHRMIMVGYLFLRVNGGGTINNSSHVNKSFPKFYNTMI
jgi:3-phosphoshikimate 1-carboxyvinyltransferase